MSDEGKPMRAYQAHDGDEGWAIVFAPNGVAARRYAANDMDCDFATVEFCRRAPSLDQYTSTGLIPVDAMLAIGWWLECTGCSRRIDEEDSDGERIDGCDAAPFGDLICDDLTHWPPLVPVGHFNRAFCCAGCQTRHEAERAAIKVAEAAQLADLVGKLMARFPAATVTHTHSYCSARNGAPEPVLITVDFMFPGAKYGAGVRLEPRTSPELKWTVCAGDVDAFEVYARETARAA